MALLLAVALWVAPVAAQSPDEIVYIQVEARTSLNGAQASVRRFAESVNDVNGFALGGGWYGVALGPYTRADAEIRMEELRRQGLIPVDSYLERETSYGQQFWPVGAQAARDAGTLEPRQTTQADPEPQPLQEPVVENPARVAQPDPEPEPEETLREARASERQLNRAEREELQIALKWAGFYNAGIDAAFGRGTRRAMTQWQREYGHEPTGVLTTRQRAQLLGQYYAVLEGLGMAVYTDPNAGIRMELPLDVVAFDRYEAPFALFRPTGDLGVRVLLISQAGSRQTMNGLYEIMQTLEIVPLEGERERDSNGFLLTGANDEIVSHTEVTLRGGQIKGFTLIWPAGDEERRSRVLGLMQASFERIEGTLDPAAVSDDGQAVDLVSGLKVRTPKLNASGFFINGSGIVLTSAESVAACERVTLDGVHNAQVVARDAELGVAVLRPEERLAPRRVAQFRSDDPRLQSEIAVAGYPFGGVLSAPTLTFGTLEDLTGLAGEDRMKRLAVAALPGDVGGPVFDAGGTVVGMLLPREQEGGRRLPDQVSFAAKAEMILSFLRRNGIQAVARGGAGPMAPEDLTALAADTTVLVSCW
ncbi:serine protease [Pseudoponticoccus marisrubri]|uniref:Peptidoglycan-binding protein n=1 Tax=Pseudoponticoccus marisrubri TaxID=1685382 RepID=A0A0W7WNR9_9RHOB|nr:serine protease [Pseudoponticoccus marisrubri]KUF12151.1 peptidoglycan-binding protein [Pseudoponticoccus marisrubri]